MNLFMMVQWPWHGGRDTMGKRWSVGPCQYGNMCVSIKGARCPLWFVKRRVKEIRGSNIKADRDPVEFTVKPFFASNTKTGKTEKHVISSVLTSKTFSKVKPC
jgi:hypothetical protein